MTVADTTFRYSVLVEHPACLAELRRRFWLYVERATPDACWLWKGAPTDGGYGRMRVMGKTRAAHRVSLLLHMGDGFDPSLCVCHSCDTPLCVNPAHLWQGTDADNAADKVAKGRQWEGGSGEENTQARLTRAQVELMHRQRSGGASLLDIAREFDSSEQHVSEILRGKIWAGVFEALGCPKYGDRRRVPNRMKARRGTAQERTQGEGS